MVAKISIALVIVLAVASGAVAAEKKRQPSLARAQVAGPVFVQHCVRGTWDPYALRCDTATEN